MQNVDYHIDSIMESRFIKIGRSIFGGIDRVGGECVYADPYPRFNFAKYDGWQKCQWPSILQLLNTKDNNSLKLIYDIVCKHHEFGITNDLYKNSIQSFFLIILPYCSATPHNHGNTGQIITNISIIGDNPEGIFSSDRGQFIIANDCILNQIEYNGSNHSFINNSKSIFIMHVFNTSENIKTLQIENNIIV